MNPSRTTFACQGIETVESVFQGDQVLKNANPGLVFDRYLKMWTKSPDGMPVAGDKPESRQVLRNFADEFKKRKDGPCDAALKAFHRRWHRLEQRMAASNRIRIQSRAFRLSWRLATGLGNFHPLENGFSFDTLTGVPFLSAAAVKGVCRRAAQLGLADMDEKRILKLFGPETIEPGIASQGQGLLAFYDALPETWPALLGDIVNCHHMEYYERVAKRENQNENDDIRIDGNQKKSPPPFPAETESPNPVFFLTVAGGADFVFRIGCRQKGQTNTDEAQKSIDEAFQLLEDALSTLGTGAKTAAGYGFFDRIE